MDPWAREGLLPNIERLRHKGTWGALRCTLPPITPSCWTSMYTGTNPGKHGIFGFFQRRPESYRLSPVHASARRAKTMFRILSEAGLKIGVLNAPATYPPERLNGMLVPGIPVPEQDREYTHPPGLGAELQALTQGKHKYPPGLAQATADVDGFLQACYDYSQAVTGAALHMMDRLEPWDLFMVQFQVTDAVHHHFWHCLDPEHPRHDPEAPVKVQNAVLDVYRTVDECVGRIVAAAGDSADVVMMSDHGGGPFYEELYLNIWLWQRGWMKFKRGSLTTLRRLLYALGITPEFFRRHVYGRAPKAVRRSVEARKSGVLALADRFFLSLDDVDWERTRAYCYGSPLGSIYINLKGREPKGCVAPEEYETVAQELERDLLAMRHPLTGEPLVEKVVRGGEAYDGPFAQDGPDLLLLTTGLRYHNRGFLQFSSKRWIGPPQNKQTGSHSLDGIVLVSGPNAKAGVRMNGASIVDIAPTVLALLGQPIPDWMDGKVLVDAVRDEFLNERAPQVVHEQAVPSQASGSDGYTAEDEAQIAKRLADLGYID